MHILIIGGTGVLSTAVTAEALKKGIKVTMINRGNRPIPDGVEHIKANKDDLTTIADRLKDRKFDAVMDYLCYTDAQTEKSVNFYSVYTKQYFYISSCAVYDTRAMKGEPCEEDSPKVLPMWKYSVDKWASEEKLSKMFKESDAHYTIIRPCVTYGDTRIPYGISPRYGYHWTLCARILSEKPIITWNHGVNRCNMTRVEDFAVGVVGLIGNPKAYNEAFNVCGDEAPSFNDVLNTMSEILGKQVITIDITSEDYAKEIPSRAGELLGGRSIDAINSNKKIKEAVPSFRHTFSLKQGIQKTIDAYKQHEYQHGIDWIFDADTDRIIKKWCKQQGIDWKQYNLGLVDYLGTATFHDKLTYMMQYHKDDIVVKMMKLLVWPFSTIKSGARKISRII